MRHLDRRRFLRAGIAMAGVGLLAGCDRLPPGTRSATKLLRIGYPVTNSTDDPVVVQQLPGLRQGLGEIGYVEERDFTFIFRSAEGKPERLPDVVAELIATPVDVLVGQSSMVAVTASRATTTIPFVLGGVPDPVGQGLVTSLAHPGGNITGLTSTAAEFGTKQLEILKETVPEASRVALLLNPSNPSGKLPLGPIREASQKLKLETQAFEVRTADDYASAFGAVTSWRADTLMVINDPLITLHIAEILAFAAQQRLPALYTFTEYAVAGGLMAYAANIADLWRRAASYIDKISKGGKPAELPIEQPTKFDFVVNQKTARALGLTIPPSVLQQATEIIQ